MACFQEIPILALQDKGVPHLPAGQEMKCFVEKMVLKIQIYIFYKFLTKISFLEEISMLNTMIKLGFAAAIIVGVPLVGFSDSAKAAAPGTCDAGTLTGVYVYSYSGFSVSSNNDHVAFAVSGSGSYDGNGHIKGMSTTTTTDGKQASVKPLPYTGVYTVTADCHIIEVDTDSTGAVTHYDEYTGPAGTAVSFVETDDNVVSAGTQTRD